jgi:hypothetical protein
VLRAHETTATDGGVRSTNRPRTKDAGSGEEIQGVEGGDWANGQKHETEHESECEMDEMGDGRWKLVPYFGRRGDWGTT